MNHREHLRIQEIEGYAEAADHKSRDYSGIFAEEREGRIQTMTGFAPHELHGSLPWAVFVILQMGAKTLKALLLIVDKLDNIESLLAHIRAK